MADVFAARDGVLMRWYTFHAAYGRPLELVTRPHLSRGEAVIHGRSLVRMFGGRFGVKRVTIRVPEVCYE